MSDKPGSVKDTEDSISVNSEFPCAFLIKQWLRCFGTVDPNRALATSHRTSVALNSLRTLMVSYNQSLSEPTLRDDTHTSLRVQLRNERVYLQEQLFRHRYLYSILQEIRDTRPQAVSSWQAFRHYNYFVFRNFLRTDPIVNTEKLSHFFLRQLEGVVEFLTKEDKTQFYVRIVALLREYVDVAVENYVNRVDPHDGNQKSSSMACLLTYYSAFISATLKLSDVLAEFNQFISERFRMNWYLFNQRIFYQYFYQRPEVQDRVPAFYEMYNAQQHPGSINLLRSYALFVENMNRLDDHWEIQRKRIDIINERNVLTENEWMERDWKMFEEVRRITKTNYWLTRSEKEKAIQDMEELDSQVLELLSCKWVTNERIITLAGTCICEDCMLVEFCQMMLPPNHRLRNNNLSSGLQQGNSALYEIPVPVKEVWTAEPERPLIRLTMCSICQEAVLLNAYSRHIVSKHPPTAEELKAEQEAKAAKQAEKARKAEEAKEAKESKVGMYKQEGSLKRNVPDKVIDTSETSTSEEVNLENRMCLVVVENSSTFVALPADSPHVQCVSNGSDGNRLVQIELPPSLASSVRALHGMSKSARYIEYSLSHQRNGQKDQSHNKPFSIKPKLHNHVSPDKCSICLQRNGKSISVSYTSHISDDLHCSQCCEVKEPSIITIFPKIIDNISIDSNLTPYSTLTSTSSYSSSNSEIDDHCYSDSSDSEIIVILKNHDNDCNPKSHNIPIRRIAHRPRNTGPQIEMEIEADSSQALAAEVIEAAISNGLQPVAINALQSSSCQCNGTSEITSDNQQLLFSPFMAMCEPLSPAIFDENCEDTSSDDGPVYIDLTSDEDSENPTHGPKLKSKNILDDDLLSVEPFRPDSSWKLIYPDQELEPGPPTPFFEETDAPEVEVNLRGVVIIPGHDEELKYQYLQSQANVSNTEKMEICAPSIRLNPYAQAPGFWISDNFTENITCIDEGQDPADVFMDADEEPTSKLPQFPNRDSLQHADGLDDCSRLFQAFIRDPDRTKNITEMNYIAQNKLTIDNDRLLQNAEDQSATMMNRDGDDWFIELNSDDEELYRVITPIFSGSPVKENNKQTDHNINSEDLNLEEIEKDAELVESQIEVQDEEKETIDNDASEYVQVSVQFATEQFVKILQGATAIESKENNKEGKDVTFATKKRHKDPDGHDRRQRKRLTRLQTIRARNEVERNAQKEAQRELDRLNMPPPPSPITVLDPLPLTDNYGLNQTTRDYITMMAYSSVEEKVEKIVVNGRESRRWNSINGIYVESVLDLQFICGERVITRQITETLAPSGERLVSAHAVGLENKVDEPTTRTTFAFVLPITDTAGASTATSKESADITGNSAAIAGNSAAITGTSTTIASTSAAIAGTSAAIAGASAPIAGNSASFAGAAAAIAGTSAAIAGTSAAISGTSAAITGAVVAIAGAIVATAGESSASSSTVTSTTGATPKTSSAARHQRRRATHRERCTHQLTDQDLFNFNPGELDEYVLECDVDPPNAAAEPDWDDFEKAIQSFVPLHRAVTPKNLCESCNARKTSIQHQDCVRAKAIKEDTKMAKRQRQREKRDEERQEREECMKVIRDRQRKADESKRLKIEKVQREKELKKERVEAQRRNDREREAARRTAVKAEVGGKKKKKEFGKPAVIQNVPKAVQKKKDNVKKAEEVAEQEFAAPPQLNSIDDENSFCEPTSCEDFVQFEDTKKEKMGSDDQSNRLTEPITEELPAMIRIVRGDIPSTVTISLKGRTPEQDKLLYTLVNGQAEVCEKNVAEPPLELTEAVNLLPLPDMSILDDPTLTKKQRKKKAQQLYKRVAKVSAMNATLQSSMNQDPIEHAEPVTREEKIIYGVDQNLRTIRAGGEVKSIGRVQPFQQTYNAPVSSRDGSSTNCEGERTIVPNLPHDISFPPGITVTPVTHPSVSTNSRPEAEEQQYVRNLSTFSSSNFSQDATTITTIPPASLYNQGNSTYTLPPNYVNTHRQATTELDPKFQQHLHHIESGYYAHNPPPAPPLLPAQLVKPYVPFYVNQPKTGSPIVLDTEKLINQGAIKKKRNNKKKNGGSRYDGRADANRKKYRRPPLKQMRAILGNRANQETNIAIDNTSAHVGGVKTDEVKMINFKNPIQLQQQAPTKTILHPPTSAPMIQSFDPAQQDQLAVQLSEQAMISRAVNGIVTIRRPGIVPSGDNVGEAMNMTDFLRERPARNWNAYSLFSNDSPTVPSGPSIPSEIDVVDNNANVSLDNRPDSAQNAAAPSYEEDDIRSNKNTSNYWKGMLSNLSTDVTVTALEKQPEQMDVQQRGGSGVEKMKHNDGAVGTSNTDSAPTSNYVRSDKNQFAATRMLTAPYKRAMQSPHNLLDSNAVLLPIVTLYDRHSGIEKPFNDAARTTDTRDLEKGFSMLKVTPDQPTDFDPIPKDGADTIHMSTEHEEVLEDPSNSPRKRVVPGPIAPPSRAILRNLPIPAQPSSIPFDAEDAKDWIKPEDESQIQTRCARWHEDNVFAPKDSLDGELDPEERDVEAFKRFCQQSIPPKRKEKVVHLNVKDIVIEKKNRYN